MCPWLEFSFAVILTAIAVVQLAVSISTNGKVGKIMADTSKLTAATADLLTKVSKLGTDVTVLLQSSANDQPAIDAATQAVTDAGTAVAALDTTVVGATPQTPASPATA